MSIRNSAEPRRLQAHLRLVPPDHSSSDAASPHDTKTSSARRFLAALLSQEEAGTAIYGSRLPHIPPPPRAKGFLSLLSPQSGYPVAQLLKGCPSLRPLGFRLGRIMPMLPVGAAAPLAPLGCARPGALAAVKPAPAIAHRSAFAGLAGALAPGPTPRGGTCCRKWVTALQTFS